MKPKPDSKPPDWNCGDDEAKQGKLINWTIDQLDRTIPEQCWRELDREATRAFRLWSEETTFPKEFVTSIVNAVKLEKISAVSQLVSLAHSDPELSVKLLREALIALAKPTGKRGHWYRPRSRWPLFMLVQLEFAAEIVELIGEIWFTHYKKRTRPERKPPTAVHIAARYRDLSEKEEEDLSDYRNHRKSYRAHAPSFPFPPIKLPRK